MEIAILILLLPFGALCSAAALYLYKREQREHRQWLYERAKDYQFQWQEFEVQHKGGFEHDYWNTAVNNPERLDDAR